MDINKPKRYVNQAAIESIETDFSQYRTTLEQAKQNCKNYKGD